MFCNIYFHYFFTLFYPYKQVKGNTHFPLILHFQKIIFYQWYFYSLPINTFYSVSSLNLTRELLLAPPIFKPAHHNWVKWPNWHVCSSFTVWKVCFGKNSKTGNPKVTLKKGKIKVFSKAVEVQVQIEGV